MRKEKKLRELDEAAIKIQSRWKGHQTRKNMKSKKKKKRKTYSEDEAAI